jgi:serine/threonine protein phosphatase 1
MYNIIGDIAGNFLSLQALIAKMPSGTVVSVGDMIDRGPRSREVVEFFMKGGGLAIKGNHEDFCIQTYGTRTRYSGSDWTWNGGQHTLDSWGGEVDPAAVQWMKELPNWLELSVDERKYFVSHAFVRWDRQGLAANEENLLWNRSPPCQNAEYDLQICGHNSQFGLKRWGNPTFAICIDSSHSRILTGIHLPTGVIYEQPIID